MQRKLRLVRCECVCVCLVECPKKQAMKYAHKHMHIVTGRFVQRSLLAIFILFYDPAAAAVIPLPLPTIPISLNIQRQLCNDCSYRGVVGREGSRLSDYLLCLSFIALETRRLRCEIVQFLLDVFILSLAFLAGCRRNFH